MKKILIVEDEPTYVDLLRDQLILRGYEIFTANNGADGLELTHTQNPDLILLDIKMPIMDGVTMLKLLRKQEYGKSTKVIMLTNLEPDGTIIDTAIDDHLTHYYVKSDTKFSDLLKEIKDILA